MTAPGAPSGFSAWLDRNARAVAAGGLVALLAGSGLAVAAAMSGDGGGEESPPALSTAPDADGTGRTDTAELALVAVKIDNAPAARPQIGLDLARFVIEAPVEGGMTRFLAFFESTPTLVGPVRSVRPVDADLVGVLAGSLVSTGGRPFVLSAFEAAGIDMFGYQEFGPVLEFLDRPPPHHMFFRVSDAEPAPRPLGLPVGEISGSGDAHSVSIPYPAPVTWEYDGAGYARFEAGEPFLVATDEESEPVPFVVDTVVVLAAAERPAGYQDAEGVDVPTFDVIGAGELLVFHDGGVVEGHWSRSAQADPYVFRDSSGAVLGLPAGRVFVHIVSRDLVVDYPGANE